MRYTQLRAFHYVAVCGGFSKAAEALHISQPAISDQVRKLEDAYDILLFDRRKRQVLITAKGEDLLSITKRMFDQEKQALEFLSESSTLNSGTLNLFVDSAYHVTELLRLFRQKHPNIAISMRVGNSNDVTSALLSYDADIGVLGEDPYTNNEFEMVQLGASPLVAFAAKNSPFEGVTLNSYAELTTYPLILRETGSKTRQKLEKAAQTQGVKLSPTIVVEGREAVREVVASGTGIGFVSTAEFSPDPRLTKINLPAPSLMMEEVIMCLNDRKNQRVIKAFMAIASDHATPS